jgi:hypothetical protein
MTAASRVGVTMHLAGGRDSAVHGQRSGRTVTYALFDDHVAMLLDEAVYHAEHLHLGVRDNPGASTEAS